MLYNIIEKSNRNIIFSLFDSKNTKYYIIVFDSCQDILYNNAILNIT